MHIYTCRRIIYICVKKIGIKRGFYMHWPITYDVNRKYWSEAGCYLYCHKTMGAHRLNGEGAHRG
jgi:hypothetical protein